jgi:putative flippase GtrA
MPLARLLVGIGAGDDLAAPSRPEGLNPMPTNPHPRPVAGALRRSAIVGIAATLVDLAMLALLVHGMGVAPAWANVPALGLGLVIQFVGNKLWAFQDRATDPALLARQGSAFLAVEVIAFTLNAALFHLLSPLIGLPPLLARVVASAAVYFGFSYRLWGRIFRPQPAPQRS